MDDEHYLIDSRPDEGIVVTLPKDPKNIRLTSVGKNEFEVSDSNGRHITTVGRGEHAIFKPKSQRWWKRVVRKIFHRSEWDVQKQ